MGYQRKILFQECDPAGILFFARVFDLCHESLQAFVCEKGIKYRDWFESSDFAVPLVHAEAFFKAPIFPNMLLDIEVKVSHLGKSSIQLTYKLCKQETGEVCAEAKTAHVFVDKKSFEKIDLPSELKNKLTS